MEANLSSSLAPSRALFSNVGCVLTENRVVVEQSAIQLRHLRTVRRHGWRLVAPWRFHDRVDGRNQGLLLFAETVVLQGHRLEALLVMPGATTTAVAHAEHYRDDQQTQRGDTQPDGERQADEVLPAAQCVTHDGQAHVSLGLAARALRVADVVTLVGG